MEIFKFFINNFSKAKFSILGFLLIFNFGNNVLAQHKHLDIYKNQQLHKIGKWFKAWELVSQKIFHLTTLYPVEFVFFDDKNIYSTSIITIPNGKKIDGPVLLGKKLQWKLIPHNGEIILPNNEKVPIGLMSFASPVDSTNSKSFFVMPLPSFWKEAGVKSEELGLEKMLTGVFLHEFSHTQQMQNFGARMTAYEKDYSFDAKFSDDIIQDYFESDSIYKNTFREEVAIFYNAANEFDRSKKKH